MLKLKKNYWQLKLKTSNLNLTNRFYVIFLIPDPSPLFIQHYLSIPHARQVIFAAASFIKEFLLFN
jgi:hypothetical protein